MRSRVWQVHSETAEGPRANQLSRPGRLQSAGEAQIQDLQRGNQGEDADWLILGIRKTDWDKSMKIIPLQIKDQK